MTPRKHSEMIRQFADDDRLIVHFWNPNYEYWQYESEPSWQDEFFYYVGLPGTCPKEPPQEMCSLGGLKFPRGLSEAPQHFTEVFAPSLVHSEMVHSFIWANYWGASIYAQKRSCSSYLHRCCTTC
jgi:hypothetical protein